MICHLRCCPRADAKRRDDVCSSLALDTRYCCSAVMEILLTGAVMARSYADLAHARLSC